VSVKGDSFLTGAVVNAPQIVVDVDGNLVLQSLQDSDNYRSNQEQAGGGLTIGMLPSASVFGGSTRINSNYNSVVERTGLYAGDDGFQVAVKGDTTLTGAVIASSERAVLEGKNSFSTSNLFLQDINNSASYNGTSWALGLGYDSSKSGVLAQNSSGEVTHQGGAFLPSFNGFAATMPVALRVSGDASSVTKAGISGIAGHQEVRTGDAETGLSPIFDANQIQNSFTIVSSFTREMASFLDTKAQQGHDPKWAPGGTYRQLANALLAGVSGNVLGSFGQLAQGSLVAYLQQQGASYIGGLVAQGVLREGSPAHAALHGIVACAGAAASGGACGSAALGASASSVLTGLFGDTDPSETVAMRAAKRNLLVSLVTGMAAATGADTQAATQAGTLASDNNWLATAQIVQASQELAAAKTTREELAVLARWAGTSALQDALTVSGVGRGLAEAGWSDVTGLVGFLQDPVQGLRGLGALLSDSEVRKQLGSEIVGQLDQMLARSTTALQVGGNANAEQLGRDIGTALWYVAGAVMVVKGVVDGGAQLAKIGVGVNELTAGATTGTVFDAIKATQPAYPGSVIPKSFEMSLPNGKNVWVAGNATEHIAEFAQTKAANYTPEAVNLSVQGQLTSLQAAVNAATQNGMIYNQIMNIGGWELKFAPPRQVGQLPSLIHALPGQ
jgi:filamentous hemagglutinin